MQELIVTHSEFLFKLNTYGMIGIGIGLVLSTIFGYRTRKRFYDSKMNVPIMLFLAWVPFIVGNKFDFDYNDKNQLPKCIVELRGEGVVDRFTYRKNINNSECLHTGETIFKMETDNGPSYFRKYDFKPL